ncbi:hypothetical protein CFVI97532_07145 [Campylobacter fetus subsp. venerealis cfvi97/532]|nr:hypothetical protein CFVI97532_07145 [Campylobacter fetus subsp. venerealis cfvi97/532]
MRVLFIAIFALIFVGCSGKVQTNKIPNEKKWNLSAETKKYNPSINTKYISEFEEYASDFFRQNIGTNSGLRKNYGNDEELDIYGVGLNRGHFSEKD